MYHCRTFYSKAEAYALAYELTAEKKENAVSFCGVKYGQEIWVVEWWGDYPASLLAVMRSLKSHG